MTTSHPASRVLLLYAACLALMLVTAVTIAVMRDAPAAKADGPGKAAQVRVADR